MKTIYLVCTPALAARLKFLAISDGVKFLEHDQDREENAANILLSDTLVIDTFSFLEEYTFGSKPVFLIHDGKKAGVTDIKILDINDDDETIRRLLGLREAVVAE